VKNLELKSLKVIMKQSLYAHQTSKDERKWEELFKPYILKKKKITHVLKSILQNGIFCPQFYLRTKKSCFSYVYIQSHVGGMKSSAEEMARQLTKKKGSWMHTKVKACDFQRGYFYYYLLIKCKYLHLLLFAHQVQISTSVNHISILLWLKSLC